MQNHEELSERKKQILKAIVESHINLGEPVGSKYLTKTKQLTCSSATIRNEMAELEEMGYLEQLHASSGRVPSELGYRFYVDSLVEHYSMTSKEINQINQLLRSKVAELDQILYAASKLASSLTNCTGIAVKPKTTSIRIKRFEPVFIDGNNLLLVMIVSDGSVKTKYVNVTVSIDKETVESLAAALNEHMTDLCANQITLQQIVALENAMPVNHELVNTVMKVIYETMSEIDGGEVKFSGVNRLLQYREYSDPEKLGELLGVIESKEEILDLVSDSSADDVSVLIGSECSVKVMDQSALIFKPIKINGNMLGAIGILGPLRMDYSKAVATIESISDNINDIICKNSKLLSGGNDNNGGE